MEEPLLITVLPVTTSGTVGRAKRPSLIVSTVPNAALKTVVTPNSARKMVAPVPK